MASGGNLVVNIGANLSGLTSGMGKAGGIVSGFAGKLAGMTGIAAGVGLAVGGIAAAFKGMGEVSAAFSDIDRISKSAASFGIATEAMVGLEHAAELSGVSTEALGKSMQKALRAGTSLPEIADQLVAIDDPAERARFAFDKLGKQGHELIPLLSGGGQAIKEMMEEGNQLAGFSGVDAAKVEAANDSISRMKLAFTGVARDIAISLAPVVNNVATGVMSFGATTREVFADIIPLVGEFMASFDFSGLLKSAASGFKEFSELTMFGIRNAGQLFQLGLLEWQMFSQNTFGMIGGVMVATWDASIAAFGAFFTNLKSGFIEIGNLAKALGVAILDSFSAIVSGENPLTAFTEGFTKTLAQQSDAINAGNPITVFRDTFTKTMGDIADGMPSVTDGLIAERERLLQGIADRESLVMQKKDAILAAKESQSSLAKKGPMDFGNVRQQGDLKGPASLQRGSAEAFSAIFSGMRGKGTGDSAEDTASNTKAAVGKLDAILKETRKAGRNSGPKLVIGSV